MKPTSGRPPEEGRPATLRSAMTSLGLLAWIALVSRYTCYGCHQHTPANIRGEHIEEGIRNFANCVDCHRSADEEDIGGGERRDGGDDDD